jgi:hypothetical protein
MAVVSEGSDVRPAVAVSDEARLVEAAISVGLVF